MSKTVYTDTEVSAVNPQPGDTEFGTDENGIPYTLDSAGVKTTFLTTPPKTISGGWLNYDDEGTTTTPIPFLGAGAEVLLTNDEAGAQTQKAYKPTGVTDVWDDVASQFDFSELSIGWVIDIRMDITVTTTSPNQNIKIDLVLAIGTIIEFRLNFIELTEKNADDHVITELQKFFVGSALVRDNPAELRISSDGAGEVVVRGWFVEIREFSL